jgi:hypothetical protein
MIPHGDLKMYKGYLQGTKVKRAIAYATIDAVVCVLFVLFLFNTKIVENRLATTMGIAGGVLPDMLVAVYELTKARWLKWFHGVHFFFHNLVVNKRGDMAFASGFAMQLVFLAALVSRLG